MSGGLIIVVRDKFGNIKKDIEITRDEKFGKTIVVDKLKKEQEIKKEVKNAI